MAEPPSRTVWPAVAVAVALVIGACSSSDSVGSSKTDEVRGSTTAAPAAPPTTATSTTAASATTTPCTQASAIRRWPLDQRAAQLVVIPSLDFALDGLAPPLARGVGGVLFLGHADAPSDLVDRIGRAKSAVKGPVPPTFMADQEGGGVQRLEGVVDDIPWARIMGASMGEGEIEALARHAGDQMRGAGIDMDLAPVLDVDVRPGPSSSNPAGRRSFGGTAAKVTASGLAFARGLTQAGVTPVVKHFPGLGGSTANTDMGTAATRPIADLRAEDLLPFAAAIDVGLPVVMVANASVPGLTDRPASVSSEVIEGLLRDELGFDGMVMTDSLSAVAISAAGLSLPQASVAAVRAGADQLLFGSTLDDDELALLQPAEVAATTQAITAALVDAVQDGSLPEGRLDDAVSHVLTVKQVDLCRPAG